MIKNKQKKIKLGKMEYINRTKCYTQLKNCTDRTREYKKLQTVPHQTAKNLQSTHAKWLNPNTL